MESMLVLLVYKKYKKLRKIKFYKNKIKLGDQFWGSSNILPINSCLQHPSREGGNFAIRGGNFERKIQKKKGKPNPKIHLHPKQLRSPTPDFFLLPPPGHLCSRSSLPPHPYQPLSATAPPHAAKPAIAISPISTHLQVSAYITDPPSLCLTIYSPHLIWFPSLYPQTRINQSRSIPANPRVPSPPFSSPPPNRGVSASTQPKPSSSPSTGLQLQPTNDSAHRCRPLPHPPTLICTNWPPARLLAPATPADPTTSSGTYRSAAILPPSASYPKWRGRRKKPIEELICSEADLKEKRERERERQTWKPWKKIKTVCLLCFFGILQVTAGEEGKKRGSRDWPSFLPGLSCGGAWTYALPVAEARGETRRHCSCGCRRPSLQFL